ncbi:MAG: NADH-quinone oxidoreductase subunit NuoF [Armatimonadota bacterium]
MEPVLTKNIVRGEGTTWIDAYEANGGYQALRKALDMTGVDLVTLICDSKLKGRGGAGFPTAVKWSAMPLVAESSHPRYLVVNFDEMEPGTFKDRFLVEGDPHQIIEGIAITAHACQIDEAFIFIRAEYTRARAALERAISEATGRGYVGLNVLGKGWGFEIHIHTSAGRYMCGEETGLLSALEGKRANPRCKPPYPMACGAWGKPTLVQNVETLACVPHIVERGAEWFISLGKAKDAGMKIYGVSGRVNRPGAYELPMGTTLRELIYDHAEGMREGFNFRAALPGGASTRFMDESQLDIPLEFEPMKELGLFFGTGTAIVLDNKTCPVGITRNLMKFYARESCGWCTPCREGLPWIEELLHSIETGQGKPSDIDLILDQAKFIGPNTFCAFAMGAVQPLESAIDKFREDFEEHIKLGQCPW